MTTPLYLSGETVSWTGFMMENVVMWTLLGLSFVCLTVFVRKYKTEIETDDVGMEMGSEA